MKFLTSESNNNTISVGDLRKLEKDFIRQMKWTEIINDINRFVVFFL